MYKKIKMKEIGSPCTEKLTDIVYIIEHLHFKVIGYKFIKII